MEAFRKTRALIHLDHLIQNAKQLKSRLPHDAFFCPMVKADAYGHGAVTVVEALAQAGFRRLGVSLLEEGIELRDFGFEGEILVFGSLTRGVSELEAYRLTPVASDFSHLELLSQLLDEPISVHLKFDTGMNRMGFSEKKISGVHDFVAQNKKLKVAGLLTHLHSGDDFEATKLQVERFKNIIPHFQSFNPEIHFWNTAGLLSKNQESTELRSWGARPGIGLYGGCGLKPVMSFRSQIVQVHKIEKGEGVSYNLTWRAPGDRVIGTVTCGYADGYHRLHSNKSQVLVAGEKVPLVGTVCMDYFMVDLTELQQKYPGRDFRNTEVTLFGLDAEGNHLDVNEVAKSAQTTCYEMFTSVSSRVPREYS